MTIKECDTCRKNVEKLNELIDDYKSDMISEVCDSCLQEINDLLADIRKAQLIQRKNFIRRFILKLRKQ